MVPTLTPPPPPVRILLNDETRISEPTLIAPAAHGSLDEDGPHSTDFIGLHILPMQASVTDLFDDSMGSSGHMTTFDG